jgi:hypothetical protein
LGLPIASDQSGTSLRAVMSWLPHPALAKDITRMMLA